MLFNSYIFILAFLPVTVIGYFLFNRLSYTAGKVFIAALSLVFYAYGGWQSTAVFVASIVLNLIVGNALCKATGRSRRKSLLIMGIILNLAVLFVFKYFNFFGSSISALFGRGFGMPKIFLPLAISFFTFQQIMYIVNIYRGDIEKINVTDYIVYISYFPKILMGPLTEPKELIDSFNNPALKKVDWQNIACGLKVFSFGLFKKVMLADIFGTAVNWGFYSFEKASSLDWLLIMFFYTFEIYFDFSGYSDMAVGISKMLNIELPANFDSPYKAFSIREFWRRWHISLTGFLTRYIYIPLGGNKKGIRRTCINIMLVFLISGIWHGANWTFILWGIIHGLFSVLDRFVLDRVIPESLSGYTKNVSQKTCGIEEKSAGYLLKIIRPLRWLISFVIINVLWLLFRSDSIEQWALILKKIFSFDSMILSEGLLSGFTIPEASLITGLFHMNSLGALPGMIIILALSFFICLVPENNYKNQNKNGWFSLAAAVLAMIASILCLSTESVFVYFNF